jgi:hypothetical protein
MGRLGRMKMSHMMADTTEELLAMGEAIGMRRSWLQDAGTPKEHFDVSLERRARAVALGAIEVTMRDMVRIHRKKRTLKPVSKLHM